MKVERTHASRIRWATWVGWGIVAGYILIAHGCHGEDHDTELFTRFWQWCLSGAP